MVGHVQGWRRAIRQTGRSAGGSWGSDGAEVGRRGLRYLCIDRVFCSTEYGLEQDGIAFGGRWLVSRLFCVCEVVQGVACGLHGRILSNGKKREVWMTRCTGRFESGFADQSAGVFALDCSSRCE